MQEVAETKAPSTVISKKNRNSTFESAKVQVYSPSPCYIWLLWKPNYQQRHHSVARFASAILNDTHQKQRGRDVFITPCHSQTGS